MTRMVWAVGAGSLTPEQRRVVQLPRRGNHLIVGPAGAGKTLVLLHRAQHLISQERVDPHALQVLVYTNVLESYIQAGFTTVQLPPDCVQSFYGWVQTLAKQLGVRVPTGDADDKFQDKLAAVLQAVERRNVGPFLEAALVDEGQDLPADAFRLLVRVAKNVTVMADYNQSIFDGGAHMSEVVDILGVPRDATMLLRDYRNGEDVARVAACFLDAASAADYLRSRAAVIPPDSRRTPVLFHGESMEDEWGFVAGVVQQEIKRQKRVGILLPARKMARWVHLELDKRCIETVEIQGWKAKDVDFNVITPKVLTIHSAKGLTFDTVVLPHLTMRWYQGVSYLAGSRSLKQLLFVACSRAREWVCLSTVDQWSIPELDALQPLIEAGGIVERTPESFAQPAAPPTLDDDFVPL
ncbi:MAG: UvrD-helicase domain-containing protein [Anaerolineae bacterium]